MKNFRLTIGDIPILIQSEESRFVKLAAKKYQAFASSPQEEQKPEEYSLNYPQCGQPFRLHMNIRNLEGEKWNEMIEEHLWINISYQGNRFFISRPDLEGEIDLINRTAWVCNRAAIYSFDSFLRILYSLILVQEQGFLVHAASVVKDGSGYLFMGRSGTGKSTITIYSREYRVLSDEISLVKKVGTQYLLYSTPFWGEQEIKGENFCSPLQGVYQLKQSPRPFCRKLAPKEAITKLMENILYFSRVPFLTTQLFHNCLEFIQQVAIHELEFSKDSLFWKVIG